MIRVIPVDALSLNQHLFLALNAGADPGAALVRFAVVLAESPAAIVPLALVGLWVWGRPPARGALLAVAAGVVVGLVLNLVLAHLYFEPRPFVIGLGHTWMAHAPDNSFPSDHATFTWSLAIGLVFTGAARRWGAWLFLYGVGVAWSRVFLGVHYPDDMLASLFVALFAGWLARLGTPAVTIWVLPPVEALYERCLRGLHLPART